METLKKNLFFVVGLLLLGGLGLYWLMAGGGGEELAGADGIIDEPSKYAAVRAEILSTVAMLQAVRLDVSVLDDPAFQSLLETPRLWEGQPFTVGRRNPFTPTP